jgi:geranylgeranyl pyrophosphate synthase
MSHPTTSPGSTAGRDDRSPLLALGSMDAHRARIEAAMFDAVQTPDPYLTELASHLVVAGGKRLRPVVSVVAAAVGAAPVSDDVVRGGVACELVHLGSLYHDDVIDDSDVRRGVETVNAKWGNLQAILAGDFLLSRASEIAASLGTEVAGLLARTIGWLCQGEIEQLRHTYDTTRTEASYLSSITNKTAVLFGTAARIGGLVAALDRHVVETLGRWATSFGMVFQIVDDILDITESAEHLGKPVGHDMEEGVYTLPVLRTLQLGHGVGEELRSLLGKPLDLAERDKALAIVRANEGVESAVSTARRYVDAAQAACDDLPPGVATDALRAAPATLLASAVAVA